MKLHIIHNDEVVEMGKQARGLGAVGVEQEIAGTAVDVSVALDASLGVEDEVVVTLALGQRLDGVGDHAVEPAKTVFAGDADAGAIAEVETGCARKGSGNLVPELERKTAASTRRRTSRDSGREFGSAVGRRAGWAPG